MYAGTVIESSVIEKVEEVKSQKKDFVLFKINKGKVVHLLTYPDSDEDLKAFAEDKERENNWKTRVHSKFFDVLKNEKDPAFLVLDFRYIVESRKCTKLIFVSWCPEKASVKDKMVFAATIKQFADRVNIPKRLEAHVPADITYEALLEKAEEFK